MNPASMEGMFNMMNNPESMRQMEQMMKNPEIQKLLQNESFMESMMNMMGGSDLSQKMFKNLDNDEHSTELKYTENSEVKLVDLKSELNYNDQLVKIIAYNESKQRYEVEFIAEEYEGKRILVKEANLVEVTPELENASRSPSPSPPSSPKIDEVN